MTPRFFLAIIRVRSDTPSSLARLRTASAGMASVSIRSSTSSLWVVLLEPPAAAEHIVHRQVAGSLPLEAVLPVQQEGDGLSLGSKAVLVLSNHTHRRVLFQPPHHQHAPGGGPEVDGSQAPVTGLQ